MGSEMLDDLIIEQILYLSIFIDISSNLKDY